MGTRIRSRILWPSTELIDKNFPNWFMPVSKESNCFGIYELHFFHILQQKSHLQSIFDDRPPTKNDNSDDRIIKLIYYQTATYDDLGHLWVSSNPRGASKVIHENIGLSHFCHRFCKSEYDLIRDDAINLIHDYASSFAVPNAFIAFFY